MTVYASEDRNSKIQNTNLKEEVIIALTLVIGMLIVSAVLWLLIWAVSVLSGAPVGVALLGVGILKGLEG